MPEENQTQEQQSLKDQAKALWAKVAWKIKKWWDSEKKEFTFWVSKQSYIVALILMLVAMWVAWAWAYFVWTKNEELISRTMKLKELSHYNLASFLENEAMTEDRDHLPWSIDEMITVYTTSKTEKERLEGELSFKTSVYNEFLRNFLLPSLNIWKDPYTKQIDIDILGRKYLDKNPYQDITLLSQWSSIIRDSWKDVWVNEVTDMRIGDIEEETENGFFKIPIKVSFKSNSKRAFLLLVDKLSLTSNVNNLWLLNDFTYYLFNAIREQKADEIKKLIEEYQLEKPADQDEKYFNNVVISRYLYNWIFDSDTAPSRLIDEQVIDTAVKQSVICWSSDSRVICYFRFRDKYRNIPELAYSIGLTSISNKPLALKRFYADIPPLIAIESFTFDKEMNDTLSLSNNVEYVGDVDFSIYGRWISTEEMNEITKTLAEKCFGSWTENDLSVDKVLEPVQMSIEQIGEMGQDKVEKMSKLIELREILNGDKEEFQMLSPYNQMIRKFEYYRMLKNVNLCKEDKKGNQNEKTE